MVGGNKTRTQSLAGIAVTILALVAAGFLTILNGCSGGSSAVDNGGHHHHHPTPTPTAAPNACLPSSSIGILVQGTDVTAYVPLGNWGGGATGVEVVPVEGTTGAPALVATPNIVNSCSANSDTGDVLCAANNTDVYLINGTTLTSTLTSGATGSQSFSGGDCETCGVVVDSTTNLALLTIGLSTGGPGAFQFVDLGATPPTLDTPIPAGADTSENVSIDPIRKYVLSPNEAANYQILDNSVTPPVLYNNVVTGAPEFDSAAEDCTTGIALATDEFTGNLFIADLTQATFTPGTPNTWTAPSQLQNFPEFDGFAAGTDGIAVAPGTHLGAVVGEFGGNVEGVIQLPATSGTGTPAVVDWVSFIVPNDPSTAVWEQGKDPHPITAYVSPNNGKAYAVFGNEAFTYIAIVDLQGLLSAPRTGHVVNEPLPAGLVTFVAL